MQKNGSLFIISAPSGAGKTSLIKGLAENLANTIISISHTTRAPREHETPRVDYHFVDETQFTELIAQGTFLEYAKVFDHFYGTSKIWLEEQLAEGKDVILEIDWQGAEQIRSQVRGTTSIFILPPSTECLEQRLTARKDDPKIVERRMKDAKNEISHYNDYDFAVVNDDFEVALRELESIFIVKKHCLCRQKDYFKDFVGKLLADQQ